MKTINILIVDDSPFQIALLNDSLTESGFNVVGEAMSLEEVKSEVTRLKPDLVTMDMTIPGTDGFECTEAIHQIDPNIKVIMVSSMMDDELIKKAKKLKVSGYVQKPFDQEELALLVNRVMADDTLNAELESMYSVMFKESIINLLTRLTKIKPKVVKESNENTDRNTSGISVVMGITGKCYGRVILDMSFESAEKLAEVLLRRPAKSKEELTNILAEVANIFSGNACSMINKRNKVFGLRVAPPTTLYGESISISKAELETNYSMVVNTPCGELTVNVGFKRGEGEWMSII